MLSPHKNPLRQTLCERKTDVHKSRFDGAKASLISLSLMIV